MTLSNRMGAMALGLVLLLTLPSCGSARQAANTDGQIPAGEEQVHSLPADAAEAPASGEKTAPKPSDDVPFELGPYTYQMLTFNGQSTADATEEYLNSGYSEAAFQLVLFDDGGGLLYTGRTMRGVKYKPNRLTVDRTKATVTLSDDSLTVVLGDDTMVFEPAGTPTGSRNATSSLAGRYRQLDNTGATLSRLRLRKNGTGAHLRANATKTTKVFWGTDPVFGKDYIMIRGVLHEFDYQEIENTDPSQYNITVYGNQRVRYSPVKK